MIAPCSASSRAALISDVAKSLDGDSRSSSVLFCVARNFRSMFITPAAGRFFAADAAAERYRLARHHAELLMADHHGIGVEHPAHDLRIGAGVGRGNVLMRADDRHDLAGVSASEPFFFAQRQFFGIADDAALRAAEGKIDQRVLPRLQHGQRHHFVAC